MMPERDACLIAQAEPKRDACLIAQAKKILRIAAAQYPIEWLESFGAWEAKLVHWVEEAVRGGAELLVFPEYGSMELTSLFGREVAGDLRGSLVAMNDLLADVDAAHKVLAARHGVHILAASFPVRGADGRYRNTARLFTPGGAVGEQQKLIMTRFETEEWHISPGAPLRVFDTALGRIGVAICYDVEFPLLAREQAEAGAALILAPSCTERMSGYWRVRFGAQARALENQCHVVHAPTVGAAPWSPATEDNRGAAAVYAPPEADVMENGILAIGEMDRAQWVFADIDLEMAAKVRASGEVLNFHDWTAQGVSPMAPVEIVNLRK
jgi:predicted amidohydrolase